MSTLYVVSGEPAVVSAFVEAVGRLAAGVETRPALAVEVLDDRMAAAIEGVFVAAGVRFVRSATAVTPAAADLPAQQEPAKQRRGGRPRKVTVEVGDE